MATNENETVKHITFACRENIVQTDYDHVIIKEKTYGNPFNQAGDDVKISMQKIKDLMTQQMIAIPCLADLEIGLTYNSKSNQMILRFSDVKFKCDKKLGKNAHDTNKTAFEKICLCADQMRNGKCRYQIGHELFPNAYKTKVFLMVHPKGNEKPEQIELTTWTDEQKNNFLNAVKNYTTINGLVTDRCFFNVHYDSSVINTCSFKAATEFTPTHPKDQANELIIEIIPDQENPLCGISTTYGCMDCLQKNKCSSPFISKMIFGQISPKGK